MIILVIYVLFFQVQRKHHRRLKTTQDPLLFQASFFQLPLWQWLLYTGAFLSLDRESHSNLIYSLCFLWIIFLLSYMQVLMVCKAQWLAHCTPDMSCLGSSPGLGHCVMFLDKTLYSHSAISTQEYMGTSELLGQPDKNAGGFIPAIDQHPIQGSSDTPGRFLL